ncbi:dihydrofolate reductase [Subsaximicrobium wynnwilliamsii]|uniref:Dihydrofolate reductase n=1 Tax=Subsaximicrobium wynnwilliamsii TaxID=291179 RepID=A0A5C6ZFM7_9FLAO|nr:NAD(P)-dependent oxidoreductase [Subsaximicrobium wynnwilliamsii]TXD82403.1 dihydrofolate reductase [Subsaximicrobium wynnwilliamsii]TXD88045.1 dihydrofolate reductase [Subsaximicrobium wynnwilliamsii]TXE02093.1 dihydrofolate reductase [Subsaximicrobium wynnwilliamsii]
MFKKLVGIDPLDLISTANKKLESFTEALTLHEDQPLNAEEIVKRIGDADGVLVSHRSQLGRDILEQCPNLKYIGMCCSLYSPESANVDIHYANSQGISVKGVHDYDNEGVVEYVVSELIRCLHGFGHREDGSDRQTWSEVPREITGIRAGIIGLGETGGMIADALHLFGAEISYFARSEKQDAKTKGYTYLPLKELLSKNEVIITCLNKNTILLHEEEFRAMGNRTILFNTGLSPAWDPKPFEHWLHGDNLVFCDSLGALGGERFLKYTNIHCLQVSTGRTKQALERLSEKVLANLTAFAEEQ